jgi:hypothetical protein
MKKIIKFLYIPFAVLLLVACNETGIFYSLENEEKVKESNNLNNSTQFTNMELLTSYYIGNSGLQILYRSTSTSSSDSTVDDWHSITLPTGTGDSVSGTFASDATNTSMVLVGNDLIISRISFDSSSIVSGIYRLPNAISIDLSTVTSSSWEMVVKTVTSKSGAYQSNIYKLHEAQDNLYINHITYDYSDSNDTSPSIDNSLLYVTASPDAATIINNLGNATNIVISSYSSDPVEVAKITSGNPGTNFWMIINDASNGIVLRSTSADFGTALTEVTSVLGTDPNPSATRFVDIYEHSATVVLLSNTKGSLYTSNDAGSSFNELTKGSAFLNGFVSINDLVTDNILVGSAANYSDSSASGNGYYQLDISDADDANWAWNSTPFSETNNYNSSDLSDASINGFLFDSTNSRLFAYTSSQGVWMNVADGSERTWSHE